MKAVFRRVLAWFKKNDIRHYWVTVQGLLIHYVDIGDSNAYPIVCIDGWMGSWKTFDRIIPYLTRDFRLIIVDMPGFGESEPLAVPHTVENISNFLKALVNKIELTRFHLIGLSLGAAVSIHFSANNPRLVDKLILQGAPFYSGLFRKWMRRGARILTFPFIIKVAQRLFSQKTIIFLYLRSQKDMSFSTDDELLEKAKRTGRASARAALESAQDVTKIDLRDEATHIVSPTLIVDGEDVEFRPLAAWNLLHSLIPNSKVVLIKDASHTVPGQKPKEFSEEVLRFLKP